MPPEQSEYRPALRRNRLPTLQFHTNVISTAGNPEAPLGHPWPRKPSQAASPNMVSCWRFLRFGSPSPGFPPTGIFIMVPRHAEQHAFGSYRRRLERDPAPPSVFTNCIADHSCLLQEIRPPQRLPLLAVFWPPCPGRLLYSRAQDRAVPGNVAGPGQSSPANRGNREAPPAGPIRSLLDPGASPARSHPPI